MKVYTVEHHNVQVYKESEISESLLEENGIDINNEEAVLDFIKENEFEFDWEIKQEDWVSSRKGGYDVDFYLNDPNE